MTEAQIRYVRVQADEDEFAKIVEVKASLTTHDADIKANLATHDTDISADLAAHDADIKALLMNLQAGQLEIIRLLLTPQGRRSSSYCTTQGICSFPKGGGV
jgi:hypothetical protein